MKRTVKFILIGYIVTFLAALAYPAEVVVYKIFGQAEVLLNGRTEWVKANPNDMLKDGDKIKSGDKSRVELVTIQGHKITLLENSELVVSSIDQKNTVTELKLGKARAAAKKLLPGEEFKIKTPNATCAVRGTDFSVSYSGINDNTLVSVFEGVVELANLKGEIVSITKGKFSGVSGSRTPFKPRKLSKKTNKDRPKTRDERYADQKREVFKEISKQSVLRQAIEDIKNAEIQNGKALIDAHGKRVRIEEYVSRPEPDQFKYVVLNLREDRFDFGKMLFTFNRDLPEDLSLATQGMFRGEGNAPLWHPTDVISVISNTKDTVTEVASGGHPESVVSGISVYYYTVFDKYDFYANDLRLWGYDNISVPGSSYYHGGTAPVSQWNQIGGPTKFHFIAKDEYSDGTWIQAEDFIINDEGKIADFSDILDPSSATAEEIRSKVLRLNFERVYTCSLFEGRTIDLVYSSKLLSDSGMLNLPSSLGAPSVVSPHNELFAADVAPVSYKLSRVRDVDDPQSSDQPIIPFYEKKEPEISRDKIDKSIRHILDAEISGGQYFVDGDNTSLKGNSSILYVPAVGINKDTYILPIYTAEYRGTKDVEELVGGGTLMQKSMEHSLYVKGVHNTRQDHTYKAVIGASGEWLAETMDETLSSGLFNNRSYTAGINYERPLWDRRVKLGYDFGITDYYNYKALSSDSRFADAGVTESMGTDVLDFTSHDFSFGLEDEIRRNLKVEYEYQISNLLFKDQKIIQRSGNYADIPRRDIGNTINIVGTMNTQKAYFSLGYGLEYYFSNQNAYDANRTYYTEDYYDYLKQVISPSVSLYTGGENPASFGLYCDLTFIKYLGRKTQDIEGNYGTNKIGQQTSGFGCWLKYPLYKQLSLRMKMNYLMSTSNMKYESVYRYNYDVVNYFLGFGWEM